MHTHYKRGLGKNTDTVQKQDPSRNQLSDHLPEVIPRRAFSWNITSVKGFCNNGLFFFVGVLRPPANFFTRSSAAKAYIIGIAVTYFNTRRWNI